MNVRNILRIQCFLSVEIQVVGMLYNGFFSCKNEYSL